MSPFLSYGQESQNEKQIKVSLRTIGHRVLLRSGDSTSRVLPIKKEGDTYRVQFDTKFRFNPEALVSATYQVAKETNLKNDYIVEVEDCDSANIVYSFQMGNLDNPENAPCQTRSQPEGCYILLFTPTVTGMVELETEASEDSGIFYILIGLLLTFSIFGYVLFRNRKKTNPNLISLGKFHFDKNNAELILAEQRIELTGKEADLLLLLYNCVNQTVEREVILNVVWGDEGDYVGRTLDVFISKLRKKLEADSTLKISNVRGVGYKLVMGV